MSGPVDLRDFLSGFLAEAGDHLRSVHANLLLVDAAVQKGVAAPRAVRELFRSLHTIKGLAGMVGIEPIVEIAHAMETVLRAAERAAGRLPAGAFEPLLEGTNAITQRVGALGEGSAVARAPQGLLERLAAIDVGSVRHLPDRPSLDFSPALEAKLGAVEREQVAAAIASGLRVAEITFAPSPQRAADGISITTVRGRASDVGEIIKVVPVAAARDGAPSGMIFLLLVATSRDVVELAAAVGLDPSEIRRVEASAAAPTVLEDAEPIGGEATGTTGIVRVSVERVDQALDGLSALLVTRMRLGLEMDRLAAAGADVRELRRVAHDITRQLAEMRRAVVGLRMLSVAELLEPLPLLVRGLRTTTGKDVGVTVDAGYVEVDKAVAERLWPAIVHLVRNAVDHGIESAEDRRRVGKPERGNIAVRCVQVGSGRIEVTIEDDGMGVDRGQVAARAGGDAPESDAALLAVVTRPGFSTRDRADATSGRGMGLDIVRRAIEGLGGELMLATTPGAGTRFTLRVPVTIAIIDVVAFECEGQTFLVPVASIDELIEIAAGNTITGPVLRGREAVARLVPVRGVAVPLIDLGEALGLRRGVSAPKAILVRRDERPLAFGVDRLLGHHAVVVRALRDPLVTVRGVTGATDMGDGRPTLILDLAALAPSIHGGTERAA